MRFADRQDAGLRLAQELAKHRYTDAIVLALPRGGVPVGYEVARALGLPLDAFIVRKLGAPFEPELGLGAIAETGHRVVDHASARMLGVSEADLEQTARHERAEIHRRVEAYRGGRALPDLHGRTVLLVDDGIATGGTVDAAIGGLRALGVGHLVLAVPVAAASTLERLRARVEEVVCLQAPEDLMAIGYWYEEFAQCTDEEVVELLARARDELAPRPAPGPEPAQP